MSRKDNFYVGKNIAFDGGGHFYIDEPVASFFLQPGELWTFFSQRILLFIVTKESNSVKICKEQHCHLENGQN